MLIESLPLPGAKLVRPRRFGDARGWFMETFKSDMFAEAGLPTDFRQDNASFSAKAGTLRGLHYQLPPFGQAKLIQVVRGRILDVIVDIRRSSPDFGRHVAVELSAEAGDMLFVPDGFAHGFCTLVDDTEVRYKVTAPYAPSHDRGLLWNDPALGIRWPVEGEPVLSDKDKVNPTLAAAELP